MANSAAFFLHLNTSPFQWQKKKQKQKQTNKQTLLPNNCQVNFKKRDKNLGNSISLYYTAMRHFAFAHFFVSIERSHFTVLGMGM